MINAVEKAQGLKKGEKIVKICQIKVTSVKDQILCKIIREDVVKEGFLNMNKHEFIKMFCEHIKCTPTTLVNRIEFEYL